MKITVLGANSYIARNMIFVLHDRILGGEPVQLFLYDFQETQADHMDGYEQVSILDSESVKKINFDVDIIYMFIGRTGTAEGFQRFEEFINVNETALMHVMAEYVSRKSRAKIIFPSTRLVYKGSSKRLHEDDEKQFLTVYAVNKFACEQYLKMYHRLFGVTYVVLRICVPYGTMVLGASSYGTAEFMCKKAEHGENITVYGTGRVRRTITHIEDLCEILIRSALSPMCMNDVYNVGGEDYSLIEMAECIAEKYSVGVVHGEWPEQARRIETGSTVFASDRLDALISYRYKNTFRGWVGSSAVPKGQL